LNIDHHQGSSSTIAKGGVAKLAQIKEEIVVSTSSLKEARNTNAAMEDALRDVEVNLKKPEKKGMPRELTVRG